MNPRIAIIVLNYNHSDDTVECIHSLMKNDYENYEVILINNGSTDNSQEILKPLESRYSKLIYIQNKENLGFAEGSNVGIRYALKKGADYVLLLNNDTVVEKDFISALVEQAEKYPNAGAISPKIYFYKSNRIWSTYGRIDWRHESKLVGYGEEDYGQYDSPVFDTFVTGCAMLISKKAIKRVGLLEKSYFAYIEDTDWCLRAKKAKFDIIYVPYPRVWHKGGKTSKKQRRMSPLHRYLGTRNKLVTIRKNYSKIEYIHALFREIFIVTPVYIVLYAYRGHFDLIPAQIGGIIDALNNKNKYQKYLKNLTGDRIDNRDQHSDK